MSSKRKPIHNFCWPQEKNEYPKETVMPSHLYTNIFFYLSLYIAFTISSISATNSTFEDARSLNHTQAALHHNIPILFVHDNGIWSLWLCCAGICRSCHPPRWFGVTIKPALNNWSRVSDQHTACLIASPCRNRYSPILWICILRHFQNCTFVAVTLWVQHRLTVFQNTQLKITNNHKMRKLGDEIITK
jgi:hypothetical protein